MTLAIVVEDRSGTGADTELAERLGGEVKKKKKKKKFVIYLDRILALFLLLSVLNCDLYCSDLVRNTPELSVDIGKKYEFDPANSCEDVLCHILQKVSDIKSQTRCSRDVEMGRSGPLLPIKETPCNVALQKMFSLVLQSLVLRISDEELKDAMFEGSHSVFLSLKERSGLVGRAHCDDKIPGDVDNSNGPVQEFEGRIKDVQVVLPNQVVSPSTSKNGVDVSQERVPDRNSPPSKRNRTDSNGGKPERDTHKDQIMQEDCYDPCAETAKKFKPDVHITECAAVEKLRTSAKDGPLADSSERIVEHIDKKRCNLENEAEIGGMDMEYNGTHDAGNQQAEFKQNEAEIKVVDNKDFDIASDGANPFAALQLRMRSSSVDGAGDEDCQLQTPIHDNIEVNIPSK
ncbi:hypothetical protein M9H77_04175 [Catharanthus roseus]|uniref:Uncharacterized protein n=1 Tax=Catharanthus roseus TaxID=4058 RepID=A0ACC0CDM0_CATRO|nr:hypothetical protein M9H77_04175 [Catharanthus roseus]